MKPNSYLLSINCHSLFRYNTLLWYTEDDFGGTTMGQLTTYNRTTNGTNDMNVNPNRQDVNQAWWLIDPIQAMM